MPIIQEEDPHKSPQSPLSLSPIINGVPIDFINHFNIDIRVLDRNQTSKLSEIYKILNDSGYVGTKMLKEIMRIERNIGVHNSLEDRFGRVWSHLKTIKRIKEMQSRRDK